MTDAVELQSAAAVPPPPGECRALCEWARGALDAAASAQALDLWRSAGRPAEDDPAVAVAVALLEAEEGDWDAVRRRALHVLDAAPDNPFAGGLAALAAFHADDLADAARRFERLGLFAAFPIVRLFVHTFAAEVRRHPERYPWSAEPPSAAPPRPAETDAEPLHPPFWKRLVHGGGLGADSEARALVIQGDALLLDGRMSDALRCFQSAERLDPENWMASMAAALCLLELGEIERAADDLIALLGRHPDVPNVASAAAWGLIHLEEHAAALQVLATLTPAGPDDWGSHYIAALAFLGLGRLRESDLALRQALGPFFLDTWEQFVTPLFHRVMAGLRITERTAAREPSAAAPDAKNREARP